MVEARTRRLVVRGGKISDGGSPAMHTRRKLFEVSTEAGINTKVGKEKIGTQYLF